MIGRYPALLLTATLLAVALRCYGLSAQPISFDEAATWYFARLSLADLWGPPALLEPNPPLFYLLVHAVIAVFGEGPGALRLLSVTCGVLCVPVSAFIARRLAGSQAGLAAAWLVATSTTHVVSSQDARAYALLTLCALVALAAEIALLEACRAQRQPTPLAWAAYILGSVLALYAHNTAVLMVAALNLVAVLAWLGPLQRQRRFAIAWIGANLLIGLAYALWLPVVLRQAMPTQSNLWLTVPSFASLRYEMMNIYAQPTITIAQPAADLLFLAMGLAGLVAHRRNAIVLGVGAFVILGVPCATWLISQWRPLINGKTLLWLVPVFLVLVALGCTHLRRLAIPATLLLVAVQLFAWTSFVQARPDEAFPEVAAALEAQARPGDAIYLGTPQLEPALRYYGWPRNRLTVFAPRIDQSWFRDSTAQPASIEAMADHPRVWLLTRSHSGQHQALAAPLRPTMTETFDHTFGRGKLRILELSLFERSHE